MRHNLIVTLVVFFAIFSLVQTGMTVYYASQVSDSLVTGNALYDQGSVNLCLNNIPTISFDCNTSLIEDVYYECQLNASDADNDTLTFSVINISGNLTYDLDNSTGLFSSIPSNDDASQSNVTLVFGVVDDSGCSFDSANVSVLFNITPVNDAPVYLPRLNLIPDLGPIILQNGVTTRGIYLNNYFSDPDGDPLNYSHSFVSPQFTVTILSTSEMIIGANDCGTGHVFLRATDPFGLYAESDLISLELECEESPPPSSSGGGAAPSPREQCVPEWVCRDWGVCFTNGTQKRSCEDIHGCEKDSISYFWRDCDYIPQCHNGVKDFWMDGFELNEDGVDCGGPCIPCETCSDGLLNNEEEETDCGGPNCDPCMSCFDGIQNYGESGVDCGGYCDPCETCFDGVQNQNETGVDCGGPCPSCRRIETPEFLGDASRSILFFLIPLAVFLLVAAVAYRVFRKQINAFIARVLWMLIRSKKKQILLSDDQKNSLLYLIGDVGRSYSFSENNSNYSYQSAIARGFRQLFEFVLGSSLHHPDVVSQIHKLKASSQVSSLLVDYYDLLQSLESSKSISFSSLNLQLELLRQLVIDIGPVSKQDIARPVHEVDIFATDGSDHVIQLLYNCILALQFEELSIARDKYISALSIYSKLSDLDQEKTYILLHLTFDNISYVSSYVQ